MERITIYKLDNKGGTVIDNVKLTKSGMIAGGHLVGLYALRQFITSNGAMVPADGNGTAITDYIREFGHYY
jgi:hypothetical protein